MVLMRILYAAIGAVSFLYMAIIARLDHWKDRGILYEPPHFFYGNFKDIGNKKHVAVALRKLYIKYKNAAPYIGMYAFWKPIALITDLNLITCILDTHAQHFSQRGLLYHEFDDPVSGELMQLENREWTGICQSMRYLFGADNIATYLSKFVQLSEDFDVSYKFQYDTGCDVSINQIADGITLDISILLSLGIFHNSIDDPETEFRRAKKECFKKFKPFGSFWAAQYPNVQKFFMYRSYKRVSKKFFQKLIDKRVSDGTLRFTDTRNEFIKFLYDLKYLQNPNGKYDTKDVAAEAFALILGGLEVSSVIVSYCIYELAFNIQLQEKVRRSIHNTLRLHNFALSISSVKGMGLLQRVLMETIRKYSPYPFIMRKALTDFEIPNSVYIIQKGTPLLISVTGIHLDKDIYNEPQEFDPDRFLPSNLKKRVPSSFLAYGFGSSVCQIQEFAEFHMMYTLIVLLKNTRYTVCDDTPNPIVFDKSRYILSPATDIIVNVEHLEENLSFHS